MVLTASLCDAPNVNEFEVNNASAYAVGFHLTMLQIYLYQYWTVAETQKEREIGFTPMYSVHTCVDLIIIKLLFLKCNKVGFK